MKTSSRFALPLALLFLASTASAAVKETEWCKIETPDTATPGKPIEIKITLKPGVAKEGDQVANHLHWMKKDGFGGMLSWVPSKNARDGATHVFRHSPKLDEKMSTISPLVFLSPDGDYKNLTKRATGASIRVVMDPAAEAAAAAEAERIRRPETATFKNSSLRIEARSASVASGDEFEIAVHYTLDPRDSWGDGTKIQLMPLGPWIDNPDGKYSKTRHHVGYPGLGTRKAAVTPGEGIQVFKYKLGRTFKYNDISWMATFIGGDGKNWPWSVRGGGMEIRRTLDHFDVVVERPGGLFTYDETPSVRLVWGKGAKAGTPRAVQFTLTDSEGRPAGAFTREVVSGAPKTSVDISLGDIQARGVILVEATIDGVATREAFIARIPDLPAILGKRRTPFGATNLVGPDVSAIARKLGLSYCRHFVNWNEIEPLPGQWNLGGLEKTIDANNEAGLLSWICLVKPPSWVVLGDMHGAGFEPFPFKKDLWRQSAETLAKKFSGRIWGFEWLNEIVPGKKSADPLKDYLAFCDIGTKAVKAIDPSFKIQMAGGLWPRNFRTDLLAAGIAGSVDVLPVHYSNRGGIREALRDAEGSGASHLAVWDNESAAGLSVWNMPALEALTNSVMQSKWVLRNWPGELTAGAEVVIYFGGTPQSAGNWTYLLDRTTPRPVAATLAVMSAKIGLARPVGTAAVHPDAILHIFERDGKGIAVASSSSDKSASSPLRIAAGATSILMTDYQGNETELAAQDGFVSVNLASMPVFLEGFDLATLASLTGIAVGNQDDGDVHPSLTATLGSDAVIPLKIRNPLDQAVAGSVALDLGGTVGTLPARDFSLKARESSWVDIPVSAAQLAAAAADKASAVLRWKTPGDIAVVKPFRLMLVRPESLGNLLKNGGMEAVKGSRPADWSGNVESVDLAALGAGPGFQGRAIRFSGSANAGYQHASQSIKLPVPGQKYLYTAWVWNDDMQAGSNLSVDGKTFHIPAVFDAGQSTKFWRLLTHIRATPANATSMSLTPVVKGRGWAMYDNVRVSLYDGTDFATEASRTTRKIVVDGSLDDWDLSDPIPLLCDNQITARPGYQWTPENLSGIAKTAWDDNALYLAAWVRDDKHVASATGEDTTKGDSLVVALHPENRADGTDAKAFQWHVGSASPGGGSGVHTLYRPASHSGGLQAGQLARDSSAYEVSIKRDGDFTTYELRIPWAETGGLKPAVGVKAGLSLQLIDKDDSSATGVMTWGGGLRPAWNPSAFGVLTLVP
ncbi:MAG: sugar-binding protein [Kiritimatiellia bacterium]|jgi:hypothetical protein